MISDNLNNIFFLFGKNFHYSFVSNYQQKKILITHKAYKLVAIIYAALNTLHLLHICIKHI